jgi:hypothetical protein
VTSLTWSHCNAYLRLWPGALLLDENETLFVSDEGCHRISMFGTDGKYLGKWGEFDTAKGSSTVPLEWPLPRTGIFMSSIP